MTQVLLSIYQHLQLFIAILITLASTSTLSLKLSITYDRASLPVAFAVGPLVLPQENYPCNSIMTERGRLGPQQVVPTGRTLMV